MTKEWTKFKDVILGYYKQDQMSLVQVMKIMTDNHGFTASQRAYRQQFQKWRIFKYNRKSRHHLESPNDSPYVYSRRRSASPDTYPTERLPFRSSYRYSFSYGAVPRSSAPAPPRLGLPPTPPIKCESYAHSYPIAHHMPYPTPYPSQSPLPSSGGTHTSVSSPYSPSRDTKSASMESSPLAANSCVSHSCTDHRPYAEAEASPYSPHYHDHAPSQSHHAEPYAHPSYYSLPTPQEPCPAVFASDSMARIQTHDIDRYSSRYPHTRAFTPPHGESPIKYSPREAASLPAASYGSHTVPLPHQSHAHLPTQYQSQVYTPAVDVLG